MDHTYLEPLFQPILDRDGAVFAYEALMRLRGHPFGPGKLVQRWERSGYIVSLDLAMLRRIGELLVVNGTRPSIAVNVSVVTVQTAGDAYVSALAAIAPDAGLVIVELTETVPITNPGALVRFYAACRVQGFLVALDDCRPGHLYATPDFITKLQPQLLKLDGPFLQQCFRDGSGLADLDRIVQAAHAVEAKVIAEFISSMELREFAFRIGADYAQGFALGMPGPLGSTNGSVYTLPSPAVDRHFPTSRILLTDSSQSFKLSGSLGNSELSGNQQKS